MAASSQLAEQGFRRPAVDVPDPEPEGRDPALGECVDEGGTPLGVGQARADGEHELAAVQVGARVEELGRVRPPDRAIEAGSAHRDRDVQGRSSAQARGR